MFKPPVINLENCFDIKLTDFWTLKSIDISCFIYKINMMELILFKKLYDIKRTIVFTVRNLYYSYAHGGLKDGCGYGLSDNINFKMYGLSFAGLYLNITKDFRKKLSKDHHDRILRYKERLRWSRYPNSEKLDPIGNGNYNNFKFFSIPNNFGRHCIHA